MSLVQRFAQVFGAAYLLVGLAGFVPPLLIGDLPPGVLGPLDGLQLGAFAVNWFHSLAHAIIGIAGLAVYRSFPASLGDFVAYLTARLPENERAVADPRA